MTLSDRARLKRCQPILCAATHQQRDVEKSQLPEVLVNREGEGKGETSSRVGSLSSRRPDGVHKPPWKHNATSGMFTVKMLPLAPPWKSLRGCPKPPHHREPGALPQRQVLPVPPPPSPATVRRAKPGRGAARPPEPSRALRPPGPAGQLRSAPRAAAERPPGRAPGPATGSPGQAAEGWLGSEHNRPGTPWGGGEGPGEQGKELCWAAGKSHLR